MLGMVYTALYMRELISRIVGGSPGITSEKEFEKPEEFYRALKSASTPEEGLLVLKKLAQQAQRRTEDYANDSLGALQYACTQVDIALKNKDIDDPKTVEFWRAVIERARSASSESIGIKKIEG